MFVETSAIVAMLTDEAKGRVLAGRLQAAPNRLTAPTCLVEAAGTLAAARGLRPAGVFALVERFAEAAGIRVLSLAASLAAPAAEAMDRFGLSPNQGLAYAAARHYRLPLLFDDPVFARTDVTPG